MERLYRLRFRRSGRRVLYIVWVGQGTTRSRRETIVADSGRAHFELQGRHAARLHALRPFSQPKRIPPIAGARFDPVRAAPFQKRICRTSSNRDRSDVNGFLDLDGFSHTTIDSEGIFSGFEAIEHEVAEVIGHLEAFQAAAC